MTNDIFTKNLSKKQHQICMTRKVMCSIFNHYVSQFHANIDVQYGTTQTCLFLPTTKPILEPRLHLSTNVNKIQNGRRYSQVHHALENANHITKVHTPHEAKYMLVLISHKQTLKQAPPNEVGVCKYYLPLEH